MKFCGIDLAAKEKNITGIAFINERLVKTYSTHRDEEILSIVRFENPDIVAMDAPLTTDTERFADKYLRKYGALSLKIPAMMLLARRAMKLASELEDYEVIEVFPTATAKILGFYRKNKMEMLPFFSHFKIDEVRNEHEVDAIIAAYTALLHKEGKTEEIDGVIIPRKII